MFFSLLNYSGIITKTKAMESQLMQKEDYERIASLESTSDFVNYLKQKRSYELIFKDYDEAELHRGQIEQLLLNSVYLSYEHLYRFASQDQRAVLSFSFLRFEINILKYCLHNIFNPKDGTYDLYTFEPFFNKHSDINLSELSAARTMEEFIHSLRDSKYAPLFEKLRNSNHETTRDYEIQLDIYYYQKVWKMKDTLLKGTSKTSVARAYGSEIDMLNILWIYRFKKYYDIEPAKLVASIIPTTYKLKKEELKKMIEAVSVEEFLRLLNNSYYKNIGKDLEQVSLEASYHTLMNKVHKINATKYNTSMAPVLYYLFLKDQELDRLTTALECIRYKLEPEQTLNYIFEQ